MGVPSLIRSRPRLICGVVALGLFGAAVHLGKRKLDRTCPRVPVAALPKPSACRYVIERMRETTTAPAWGLEKPVVAHSTWSGGDDKTHWIPSFAALQFEVPLSILARYGKDDDKHTGTEGDAFRLMQAFVAAFMDARGEGPEAWVLDKELPPGLSFAPGSQLFGDRSGLGAFVLDTWSTARRKCVQPLALPKDAPQPVSEFPPNTAASHGDVTGTDTAGTVMYWRFADGTVRMMDKAASYGLPWRLMEGGFQEFIVEKVSDETARVTYAMVESASLYPGGQSTRDPDFKRMPWLAYELHVLYAQFLLYKTLKRLRKS